jgi:hypothetical protein
VDCRSDRFDKARRCSEDMDSVMFVVVCVGCGVVSALLLSQRLFYLSRKDTGALLR